MVGIVNAAGLFRTGIRSRLYNLHLSIASWGCTLALCFPLIVCGQSTSYRFKHLTIDDGLSQNLVYSIVQDKRGFMWFGTNDGLNRYDGYEFEIYNHLPGDTTSLIDNEVWKVFLDSRGELWVGAGGLNRYDPRKDRFERILTAKDLPGDLSTLQIYDIEEDRNGHLWIAMRNAGIFRLEIPKGPNDATTMKSQCRLVGPYLITDGGQEVFSQNGVHQMAISEGYLLVSHEGGVSRLAASKDGQFPDPATAQFESVPIDFSGAGNALFAGLYAAAEGGVWIGTSLGLVQLPDPAAPKAMRYFPYPPDFFKQNWEGLARKIVPVDKDRLWIATYSGILVFNSRTGDFEQHLQSAPSDPESLGFNNVPELFVDRGGVIWLGTSGMGVNKYVFSGKPFRHYLGKRDQQGVFSIYDLVEDHTGRLWAALNGGKLGVLDRATGNVRAPSTGRKNWVVNAMTIDREGKLWINHNNRFLINLDPLTETWQEAALLSQQDNFVETDSVWSVYVDAANQPWVCNTTTLGRVDRGREIIERINLPRFDLEKVETFLRDPAGRFWIATLQGLLRFELSGEWGFYQASPLHPDSLRHNRLKSLLLDPDQPDRYLWIGGGGLSRLDMRENTFRHYTEADGLCDDFIYGLLADEGGDLWISTNRGLARFDREQELFTNYYVEDGLQSNEFNSRAYFRAAGGELFFGGINGINAFFPGQIQANPHVPPVVITDIYLSYESLEPGRPGSPLHETILETEVLDLAHHQNHVAFEFAALDFSLPEKNSYRYKLEGFDEGWVDAGAIRRATYTNLPPGDYTFRVKGANNDGVWNEEGASIHLRIAPSPWQTWWAYSIYLYVLLVLIYVVYRNFSDRRDMREELRIKELEKQKLAELDRFKSEFFANVSHEFRTPITLIQGRIEELLSLLKRNDLREKLQSMKKSSRQLLRLIEQLLDIARLEASKVKLHPQWGDLASFLKTLTFSLQSAAEIKGVNLDFKAADSSLPIDFDRDAVQKVMQNLISNAIKFTPVGGRVVVGLEKIGAESGEQLRLTVSDTGAGIPAKDIPHIFDRFYQAENDATNSEKGFGLGLALVRELVLLQEGSLHVESEVGKGTTFSVLLPYVAKPSEQSAAPSLQTPNPQLLNLELADLTPVKHSNTGSLLVGNPRWKHLNAKVALIVEDNTELRRYIADILQPVYKVLEAKDGREALPMAVQHIPDIIVSDVMMPHMDGFELSEQLRTDPRTSHIPLILLTARAEMDDWIKGLEIGVDDYLIKPFQERELITRINNLIRRREALKRKYSQSLLGPSPLPKGDSLDDKFLQNVRGIIERNLEDENFSVEVLAKAVNMSASQLYRKLKALTEISTVQLIQRFRLERAAVLLQQGHNVTEVAYRVGLRSPAYFSQLFKKHFGCSPKEYEGV